jgi:RNA polymerase sigma-70 factor (ECF subfamily)
MTVEEREQRWAEAMRAERRGEAAVYERMLKEVATALRRSLAPRLVRVGFGAHETEDLVQEILIGLHNKRHTWDPARPFLPWLHTITRYKLIDFMRHRRRDTRRRVDLPLDDWLEMVDPPADEAIRSTWEMDRHLAVLPVSQRKLVRAIAVEGGSVRSVAQQLATSEGVVRVTLHRAISRLLEAADATPTIKPCSRSKHDEHR